jgi:uncharacterized membrane protein (DUF373 family)
MVPMADPSRPLRPRTRFPSRPEAVTRGIAWVQEAIYIAVGVLLAAAGILVIVGTVDGVVTGIDHHDDAVQIGLQVLDRVLLLLIVAELLHTLALVLYEGEIHAEPFLLVGLIAVVRRVVVITAKVEQIPSGQALNNFLLELGVLAGLALAFGAAIYLLRRGDQGQSAAHSKTVERTG